MKLLTYLSVTNSEGQKLYGTLHKTTKKIRGTVLVVHGHLSSNRIGPHRLYYEISSQLCDSGYNVARFDLRGMGESEGSIEDTRFEDHVNDVITIIKELSRMKFDRPFIIISHCIGCNVSLDAMEDLETIDEAIFIAPFFANDKSLSSMFTKRQLSEMNSNGFTFRKGIYTNKEFIIDSCAQKVFFRKILKQKKRIVILYGDKDQFIQNSDSKKLFKHLGQREVYIDGGDHNFLSKSSREKLISSIFSLLKARDYK